MSGMKIDCDTFVVGANSFLGQRYCERLLSRGDSVIGSYSSEETLNNSPYLDVKNFQGVIINFGDDGLSAIDESYLQAIKCRHIVVFSGYYRLEPLKVSRVHTIQKMFDLNCIGPMLLIKYLAKKNDLLQSVVLTGSVAGVVAEKGLLAYGAAKSALIHSMKILALELAASNVRVNCVSPGWINSPVARDSISRKGTDIDALRQKYPLGLGEPDDVFGVYDFLLSPETRWITGQNIIVDGGFSLNS